MKVLGKMLLFVMCLLMIVGCNKNEEKYKLLFFSEIPESAQEDIEAVVKEAIDIEETGFELLMFPVTYERLVVEIAGHNGDILFLKEELMSAAYDPVGLIPLDEVLDQATFEQIPYEYKNVDKDTGETHVHALPLNNESPFLKRLGIELEEPLVAIIPIYSENKAFSIELLRYIMDVN
ncbi:hypothetical protein N0O92_06025 [Alkalihalobacillus sp. MEB130]|uniref:hypothetical protein n=1 Tax=Alkalihalobacillus sp. MEB130 TaxID=2976704 RepID=UPI0028DDC089|nr:hypothetical protein [Alkalihalobacillus sp. MEB130]MDT8859784.1 hypothetical protein [Alkalihalobacillus sp. MEB130]